MTKLIKHGAVVDDRRQLLREIPETGLPIGAVVVPLNYWLEHRAELSKRSDIGVWLSGDRAPEAIAADLDKLAVIAIDFALFTEPRFFLRTDAARTLRLQTRASSNRTIYSRSVVLFESLRLRCLRPRGQRP